MDVTERRCLVLTKQFKVAVTLQSVLTWNHGQWSFKLDWSISRGNVILELPGKSKESSVCSRVKSLKKVQIFCESKFNASWKGWGRHTSVTKISKLYFVFVLYSYITSCEMQRTHELLTHSSFLSSAGFPSGCYKLKLWSSSHCRSGLLAVKRQKKKKKSDWNDLCLTNKIQSNIPLKTH